MEDLDKVYAQKIAEEYAPKTTSKVMRLKKLDSMVKRPAMIVALTLGIIGALALGAGMCFSMGKLGTGEGFYFILGIIVGVAGLVMCAVAYPLYSKILKSRKDKYAFEITELAKEITEDK